jgi:hypothetical protein
VVADGGKRRLCPKGTRSPPTSGRRSALRPMQAPSPLPLSLGDKRLLPLLCRPLGLPLATTASPATKRPPPLPCRPLRLPLATTASCATKRPPPLPCSPLRLPLATTASPATKRPPPLPCRPLRLPLAITADHATKSPSPLPGRPLRRWLWLATTASHASHPLHRRLLLATTASHASARRALRDGHLRLTPTTGITRRTYKLQPQLSRSSASIRHPDLQVANSSKQSARQLESSPIFYGGVSQWMQSGAAQCSRRARALRGNPAQPM